MTVTATWKGSVIARSDNTVLIENNHYFPRQDIVEKRLELSDTTSHCPWKGEAKYYTLNVDGDRNVDAAWEYPDPKDAAKEIQGFVAFWKGVEVSEE